VKNKKLKLILNLGTLAILALVVYSSRHDLSNVISELYDANLLLLLLLIPLQLLNYHAYARMYQEIFGHLGEKVQYWDMTKVSVEMSFVNYVFPSAGISGFGYFGLRMRSFGVRATRSTLAQTMRWVIVLGSFIPVLGLGVFLLSLGNQVSNIVILAASGLSFGVILLILCLVFLLEKKDGLQNSTLFFGERAENAINFFKKKKVKLITEKRKEWIEANFKRVEHDYKTIRKSWRGVIYTCRWGIFANITEVATIGVCFMVLGASPVWGAIIIAYGVANIGSFVAVLPGGHGVYEALMTGVLVSGGVPASLSLTAVLTYRLATTVLYVPPGYYFYSKAIGETKRMKSVLKKEDVAKNK
jgi:uncharacterized protein (TIRG00374 family)